MFYKVLPFILITSLIPAYYGQFFQDQFVNEQFFKDKKNGFFIDIGASDGITGSNTYFFEKHLGWTGICVEPVKQQFEKLKSIRSCICLNACISNYEGPDHFFDVTDNVGNPVGISGLVNKYDAQHWNNITVMAAVHNWNINLIPVHCFLFNNLQKMFHIYKIDYLSIDVEGAELDILMAIDFSLFDIEIIDVENNYEDEKIRSFLSNKNYEFVARVGVDDIYRKKENS